MSRKKSLIRTAIIALVVVFLIIFLSGYTSQVLSLIQKPFLQAGTWLAGSVDSFKNKSTLLSERDQLQDKIESLVVYEAELEALRSENENLKLQLGYISESSYQTVSAAVTTRSDTPTESLITIDKGDEQGIEIGDPVIAAEGIMIGKISEVKNKRSVVRLLNDRSSKTAATILDSSRTLGLIEGTGGTLLDFNYIPQNVELSQNSLVVSSGLESGVPPGLVIGMINSIEVDPSAPFQKAIIEPIVDYRTYTMVSVMTIE